MKRNGPERMITQATLDFLGGLKQNNNRAWFAAHRPAYESARAEFINLVDALIAGLAHFEPRVLELDPAACVFRIHRDTRFARHTAPFKPHLGAFITDRGRNVARAGYYVHLEPGASLVAGGLYMPPAPELKAVRGALLDDAAALRRIIGRKNFVAAFGRKLPGARLKTAPRDVPRDHPDLDLLRLKSYEIYRRIPNPTMRSPRLAKILIRYFATMHAYVAWLNRALDRPVEPGS